MPGVLVLRPKRVGMDGLLHPCVLRSLAPARRPSATQMQTVWMVWTGLFLATGVLSCLTAVLMLTLSPTLQGHVRALCRGCTLQRRWRTL